MSVSPLAAAPYGPQGLEISHVQPGGTTLQLRVFGDEYFARTETLSGYTVIAERGAYYYAKPSADGSVLESVGVLADRAAPAGLEKHAKISDESANAIRSANREKYDGKRIERWNQRVSAVKKLSAPGARLSGAEAAEAEMRAAPVTGSVRGLTILVQFPDDPEAGGLGPIAFPTTRAKIVDYCNKENYRENGNTGSIRDYFRDQSLGRLDYTQKVTTIVTLPEPRDKYNFSDYPLNETYNDEAGRDLLKDALAVLVKNKFDFSGLSKNAAGEVLATNIFFAGPSSGEWSQGLWPHQWYLQTPYNVGTSQNPIYINNYQITNLANSAPVIGTFCHENGHLILDYPDLYDYGINGPSDGVGNHCLMGGGSHTNEGKTPMPINAYFKDLVGWGNVVDITADQFLTASLRSTGNRAYRISKPGTPAEAFFVENRGSGDKWAAFAPDKGIAIWHVDGAVSGNNNQQMTATQHYQVSLEQADGNFDLERNRLLRESTDLFDLNTPVFSNTSRPDSKWWDGSASNFRVEVLSRTSSSMDVSFGVVPPNTIIVGAPNGGELLYPSSKFPISWRANITGNVRIDLLKGGAQFVRIAENEANDGRYDWSVPADLPKGGDYSIRISSLTNAVATQDGSDALFGVNTATFPLKATTPYGWHKPAGYATTFSVDKETKYEGKASLASNKTGDGRASAIAYTSDFVGGNVSFYIKVSSEFGFDVAKFYVDGVAQTLRNSTVMSGNVGWTFVSIPISAGTHTLKWTFEKDESFSGLQDTVWIDAVSMPRTTQEIAVRDAAGINVTSGMVFPETSMDSKSKAKSFTIRNTGGADLHSLRVSKVGSGSGDFEIVQPKKTALTPGGRTTFNVVFAPKSKGPKSAKIIVHSNDALKRTYEISVQGNGLGVPRLAVSQPASNKLTAGAGRKFGSAKVGSIGQTKTFTITNSGELELKNLKIAKSGLGASDFRLGKLGSVTLAPGESTKFTVTFRPSKLDKREARIQISSNDKKTGRFVVEVSGIGTARKGGKKSASAVLAGVNVSGGGIVEATLGKQSSLEASSSVEVVSGVKYRSLTVAKVNGEAPGTVEVSSNLLDWFSGAKHTTVLIDNAQTLKVRDNTPIQSGTKRYIRIK